MGKAYIFITADIHFVGGAEAYTAGKARYLEKIGWTVYVFFPGSMAGECGINSLNKYLCGGIEELGRLPYELCEHDRERVVQEMADRIQSSDVDEITVESHFSVVSFWGELLAEKMGGRHYAFPLEEYYRVIGDPCEANLDFFFFKLERNELIASDTKIRKLFNGYKNITKAKIQYSSLAVEQDMVEDVDNIKLDMIETADYNICSIGRLEKPYMKWAIEGVKEFALAYPQKIINFIVIGDETACNGKIKEEIDIVFRDIRNVRILYLGVLVPIPRKLFSIVDVVIAAAQTAIFSSHESAYTITAHVTSQFTPGVLGYDTQNAWWGDVTGEKTYCEALMDVLVREAYRGKKFSMPKREPAEYHYQKHFDYFRLASQDKAYYTKTLKTDRRKTWTAIFPFWKIKKGERILLYGAGKVGHDYIRQIRLTDYCIIKGIVDTNADRYDASVVFPEEGLAIPDYDAIVIAIASETDANEVKSYIERNHAGKRLVHDIVIS